MTRVLYEPNKLHLRIEGHAGSAPKGEDLVCAGVSALGFTLLLAAGEYYADIVTDEDSGLMEVTLKPQNVEESAYCFVVMNTIADGLELLAYKYPEYVTIERRD
ncbi:MAG: ribosomal-processing cysteine protease Prp [Oscillospiraceae bacterium]|nr:ribosomal-processing cysteine protease Prp [Oscillospiraceae bacterium]